MYKHAVIICGGKGSRLIPLTESLPKALLPIGNYPILEIIIMQLKYYGFKTITLSVCYMAEHIMEYFGDGHKLNVSINYSMEEFPLGTAGPLKILDGLPDNFLVTNCDILTNLDFDVFFNHHLQSNNLFSIVGYRKKFQIDFGVLEVNCSSQLVKLAEKPETLLINAGLYAANKKILNYLVSTESSGMNNLIDSLLQDKQDISVYPFNGYWCDIGTPLEYQKALVEFNPDNYDFIMVKESEKLP